jgi:4-amino-4-deoxy-L-arabinose transferase-like glycosyltransferase
MHLRLNEMTIQSSLAHAASARRRGIEIEYLILLLLIALIYTTRIASPPIRGEESRRATVTMYFLETGNYIVPQQQGNVLYMSARPPVQNWLMLPFYAIFHNMGLVTIRLPSILAVFITSSLIYFYGRVWMSRLGAFAASLAFATMLQVMELGRTAETDLVFSVFVTAGLFGWHYFFELRKMPARAWVFGYGAIALATLTKGPQAPVYFFGSTFLYLSWTRRFWAFFDKHHAVGLCIYAAIVGGWLVPYYLMTGKTGVVHVFTGDVGVDPTETAARIVTHLLSFPYTLFACLLPWSGLLVLYCRKSICANCVRLSQPLAFAAIAFGLAFLTVWLVPGSKTRFLLNVFPCAAICVGIALDCAFSVIEQEGKERAAGDRAAVRNDLFRFANIIGWLAFLAALFFIVVSAYAAVKDTEIRLAMSLPRAIFFAIVSIVLGSVIIRNRHKAGRESYATSLFCVAAFFGLLYNLPIVDYMNRWSQRTDIAFEELYEKRQIPDNRTLVSLGEIPPLINYLHFQQLHVTIPKVTLAEIQKMRKTNDVYFVSDSEKFPIQYTLIAKLPMRRYQYNNGNKMAIFGKVPAQKNL